MADPRVKQTNAELSPPAQAEPIDELISLSGIPREPSHGDAPLTPQAIRAVIAAALGVDVSELRSLSKDGAQVAIDRLNELVRRLTERAATDELTGVLRRGAGYAAAQGEIHRAHRAGGDLVLVIIDVDGLKRTNDTNGHLSGDHVLRTVAAVLQRGLRPYDIVIRFGGDEFLCVMAGVTSVQARARVKALSRTLDRRLPGQTISAGYADLGVDDGLDDLISRADADLYAGRRSRRTT